MARPCGCGETCNCVIEDGTGTDVSGAGTQASPFIIDFDGGEVIDQGLIWNASTRKLSTKLAFGGGIEFDPNGAMRLSGDGPDPGGPIDLIQPLEAPERVGDVFCGLLGAGNLIKPESFLRSYEYGLGSGVDLMHVGVRYLHDGTPVASWDEQLGRTVYHPYNVTVDHWQDRHVEEQTSPFWGASLPHPAGVEEGMIAWQPHRGQNPLIRASWDPARPHAAAPAYGWFGYMEPPQWGGVFLSDILRTCRNNVPLVLHLRFPSTIQEPTQSPAWRSALFLRHVRQLIERFRMQAQVIVTTGSDTLEIPAPTGDVPADVLAFFQQSARIGPALPGASSLTQYPPASFAPRNWTWGFLWPEADPAILTTYADAGINVLISTVNRQYYWESTVDPAGIKGVISGDPFYYGGALANSGTQHILASRGYRHTAAPFRDRVILHGLLNPHDTDITQQLPLKRGSFRIEPNDDLQGQMYLGVEMDNPSPNSRSYWVLQGWASPAPSVDVAQNYSMNFHFQADDAGGWTGRLEDWLGLAFSIPTDHKFRDWASDSGAPRPGYERDTGYAFYQGQNSQLYITYYDQGNRRETAGPFATITPVRPGQAGRKQYRLCVDPRGVLIAAVTSGGLVTLGKAETPNYQAVRGDYFYVGRRNSTDPPPAWIGRFIEPVMYWGRGTSDWDEAEGNVAAAQLTPGKFTEI